MLYIIVLICGLIFFTFLGYIFHRMFHQPWSGRFYKAHMTHHVKLYPPSDFVSDQYRDPKNDNTVWLFGLVFAPVVLTAIFLTIFRVIPLGVGLTIMAEMGIIGWLNNSQHDSFHLKNTFWHKFWFFPKLIKLHYQHHIDMRTNYGIFSFWWDKIFRTFKE